MHCVIRPLLGMLLLSEAIGAKADLVASPAQLDFEVQAVQTTSAPKATTLRNTGDQSLTVVAIATFLPPSSDVFARTGGSCGQVPFTLAPQATCTIEHTFAPASISTYNETIRLTLAGGETVDFGLLGEGDIGRLEFTPSQLDFFPAPVGSIGQELTASVQNIRQASVQVTGYALSSVPAVSAFVRTGGSCPTPPFELLYLWTCTLSFTFVPAQEGESTMTLYIQTSGASGNFPLWLRGDGELVDSLFSNGFEALAGASIQ